MQLMPGVEIRLSTGRRGIDTVFVLIQRNRRCRRPVFWGRYRRLQHFAAADPECDIFFASKCPGNTRFNAVYGQTSR